MTDGFTVASDNRLNLALRRAAAYAGYAIETIATLLPRLRRAEFSQQVLVDGLIVKCHRALPEDSAFAAAWEELYRRAPDATPFQSPAWQRSLLETAHAMRRLRVFTVYDRHRLIAVLPLELRRGNILRTSGALLTDYLDPLIDPEYSALCWPAMLRGIKQLAPGRSLVLENILAESFSQAQLAACAAAGFNFSDSAQDAVSRIALPKTWDDYLASLDRHERKELKRKLNKAEQKGNARLEICNDPAAINHDMNAMFDLIQDSGGCKARKAKWLFPRHFASAAPTLAASGGLVVYKLFIEDRHAASLIALPTRRGQILWNTAFDISMKSWSPGIVLFAMLIRRAIEHGETNFDLLRGQYDYKYRLGAADHPLHRLTFRPAA
ncbi:MAG TPA: GNAT family N-acetyltransferase [Tepidisphaeraceae bacterium]|nr:GNAT family N-acetyltransferase [Tepidisphaeraceae bacterium]